MSEPIHIISLGAGVQSSTMALMADVGEVLPLPKLGVFADTMAEPKLVYEWLEYLKTELSFPIITVSKGSLEEDCLRINLSKKSGKIYVDNTIPAYAVYPDGKKGLFGRRCTYNHKVAPIVKYLRDLVGKTAMKSWREKHRLALDTLKEFEFKIKEWKKSRKTNPQLSMPMKPLWAYEECQSDALVIQWIGISIDESHRIKPNYQPWIRNRYPLIDMAISRGDCIRWMKKNNFPEPPRSACTFCPFHSDEEWNRLSKD